ncbi:hypothetical protein ACP275_03G073000 [Erythranthe tilingii]
MTARFSFPFFFFFFFFMQSSSSNEDKFFHKSPLLDLERTSFVKLIILVLKVRSSGTRCHWDWDSVRIIEVIMMIVTINITLYVKYYSSKVEFRVKYTLLLSHDATSNL